MRGPAMWKSLASADTELSANRGGGKRSLEVRTQVHKFKMISEEFIRFLETSAVAVLLVVLLQSIH